MKKIEKILTNAIKIICSILLVILTIIAFILIYNIIQIQLLGKDYMNIFGYSMFQVQTGSMSGTIETGDIILVKLTKDVNNNDIITFKQNDIIITHRIIKYNEEEIITKGDANNTEDEPITKDSIIGKVVFTLKNIQIWKQVLTTPEVYILIIITLILFGISISIKDKETEKKENIHREE